MPHQHAVTTTNGPWTTADLPPQHGKTAIVTGTGGIGYECGLALAGAGADVIVAGRNPAKGDEAVGRILQQHPRGQVRFEVLDLADLASVRDFADRMRSQLSQIDILINNAAVMALPQRQTTKDGFEMQFGTNHLGHFALTLRLLPLLRGGRVTTVSSSANQVGRMRFDDLQSERRYSPMMGAYAMAKVANILFAAELQRRADAVGMALTSNCAHPGFARTDILANGPGSNSVMALMSRYAIAPLFSQSAAEGALPVLYAATSPAAHGFEYYGPGGLMELRGGVRHAKIVPRAGSVADATRLWDVSEELTGVAFPTALQG